MLTKLRSEVRLRLWLTVAGTGVAVGVRVPPRSQTHAVAAPAPSAGLGLSPCRCSRLSSLVVVPVTQQVSVPLSLESQRFLALGEVMPLALFLCTCPFAVQVR